MSELPDGDAVPFPGDDGLAVDATWAQRVVVVAVTPTARLGDVADGAGTSRPMQLIGIDAVIALNHTLSVALTAFPETPPG